jgi:prepilin-type N-terminal cleavage/methylation domain-containing protein
MVRKKQGFTLIELLVVIAIIGVLSSVIFVSLGPARKRSRDARRKADLRQINTAMEVCYNDNSCAGGSKYPSTTSGVNTLISIGSIMTKVPVDPVDTSPYQYTWTDGANEYYCLYVKSESLTDTWFCSSNRGVASKTLGSYTPSNTDCCGVDVTE